MRSHLEPFETTWNRIEPLGPNRIKITLLLLVIAFFHYLFLAPWPSITLQVQDLNQNSSQLKLMLLTRFIYKKKVLTTFRNWQTKSGPLFSSKSARSAKHNIQFGLLLRTIPAICTRQLSRIQTVQKPKNSLKIPTLPHFFLAQTISLICYSSVLLNFHFWPENLSFVPSQCQALNQSQSSNENWKKKTLEPIRNQKNP